MQKLVRQIEMNARMTPQLRMIMNHVRRVGYITGRAAIMDYGIASLSRRMVDLQELGFGVTTERRKNPATGQRYVRYYVKTPAQVAEEKAAQIAA